MRPKILGDGLSALSCTCIQGCCTYNTLSVTSRFKCQVLLKGRAFVILKPFRIDTDLKMAEILDMQTANSQFAT